MLETFTLATFAPHVDATFRLTLDDGERLDLRLAEAGRLGGPAIEGGRDPFSLVFPGPLEPVPHQRIWPLRHHALGDFQIFLVPLGPRGEAMCYEAGFALPREHPVHLT